jgi:hypothetical protein
VLTGSAGIAGLLPALPGHHDATGAEEGGNLMKPQLIAVMASLAWATATSAAAVQQRVDGFVAGCALTF